MRKALTSEQIAMWCRLKGTQIVAALNRQSRDAAWQPYDDDLTSHDRCAIALKTGRSADYNTTLTSGGGGGKSLSPPMSF